MIGLGAAAVGVAAGDRLRDGDRATCSRRSASTCPTTGTVVEPRTVIVGLAARTGARSSPALTRRCARPRAAGRGLREGAVRRPPSERRRRTAAASCSRRSGSAAMALGIFGVARPRRGLGRRRRGRSLLGVACSPAAGPAGGVGRSARRWSALRGVPGTARARERGPQPRPHGLDGGGADDRPGAGLVRRRVRRRDQGLDRRRDRQDPDRRPDDLQRRTASPTSRSRVREAVAAIDGVENASAAAVHRGRGRGASEGT